MIDGLVRDALFAFEPESAHDASLLLLEAAQALPGGCGLLAALYGPSRAAPVRLAGLQFRNPIGLAAGYDKDGRVWRACAALGFGHVEVGTVTPQPQVGNDRPRVFRLVEDRSLINRLGFPSEGIDAVRARLGADRPHGVVLGINVGKNKDTPLERAHEDYVAGVHGFGEVADYLTVNVSSPNTPRLRELQAGPALRALLAAVSVARDEVVARVGRGVPLFVKLSPDLDDDALDDALGAVDETGVDGVIATNTTVARPDLIGADREEGGGLSGAALTAQAQAMIRRIRARAGDDLPLIGVGGIMTRDHAVARLDAGADLVQVYSGMVFAGPSFAKQLVEATAIRA